MADEKDRVERQNARKDQQEPVGSPDAGITGRMTPSDPGSSETYLGQQGMHTGGLNEPTSGGERDVRGGDSGGEESGEVRGGSQREVSGNVAPSTGTRLVSGGNSAQKVDKEAIADDPKSTAYGGPDTDMPPGQSVYTDATTSGSRSQGGHKTDAQENVNPNTGGTKNPSGRPMQQMNPSAPNTGTSENSTRAHGSNPTVTNPGKEGGGDVRNRESFMPGTGQGPDRSGVNPNSDFLGPQGAGHYEFRCVNVGQTECPFTLRGDSPEQMLPQIEQHAREAHNLELKGPAIQHVRDSIQPVDKAA